MVEVFKTNVQESCEAERLVALLRNDFPETKINFDLQDCDKILRVEGQGILAEKIMELVNGNGFLCDVLE